MNPPESFFNILHTTEGKFLEISSIRYYFSDNSNTSLILTDFFFNRTNLTHRLKEYESGILYGHLNLPVNVFCGSIQDSDSLCLWRRRGNERKVFVILWLKEWFLYYETDAAPCTCKTCGTRVGNFITSRTRRAENVENRDRVRHRDDIRKKRKHSCFENISMFFIYQS